MSDPASVGVAAKVREHRTRANLTQLELAERSGLGLRTVLRVERGASCQVTTLEALARGLGVAVADLVVHEAPAGQATTKPAKAAAS